MGYTPQSIRPQYPSSYGLVMMLIKNAANYEVGDV
jgi:hypothetical protein